MAEAIDTSTVREYLSFVLAGDEYAVEILKVREIKGWTEATPIPNAPPHMLGIINLRGDLIPVFDLRRKLALKEQACGPATVIVFVAINFPDHDRVVGLVADAVAEVRSIGDGQIQPAPAIGRCNLEYIRGMVLIEEKVLTILDIDRLFTDDYNDAFAHAA